MQERDGMVAPERTEVTAAGDAVEDAVDFGDGNLHEAAQTVPSRTGFGALEGAEVDAFDDDTRAAPVGPTQGAHLRDLTGTPNEGIAEESQERAA